MNWTWLTFVFATPVWVSTNDPTNTGEDVPVGYALTAYAIRSSDGFLTDVNLVTEAKGQMTVGLRNIEVRVGDWTASPEPMYGYFAAHVVTFEDSGLKLNPVYCAVPPGGEVHTMTYGHGRTMNGWATLFFSEPTTRRSIAPERDVYVSGEVWTAEGWQWFGLVTEVHTMGSRSPPFPRREEKNAQLCPLLQRPTRGLWRLDDQDWNNRRTLLFESAVEQARKLDPLSDGTLDHGTCVDPGEVS